MVKLSVNNMLVGNLIAQVAPVVEAETGWTLDLPGMQWRVLPKSRGYEEIVQGRLRNMGLAVEEGARSLPERLVEIVLESKILAAYEPGNCTLFVVRENVDDSNLQGLMVILAHELVHRGQHLHHPELFKRVDAVARALYQEMNSGSFNSQAVNDLLASIRQPMTLIESHATYVQSRIQERYYREARIESHYNFLSVLDTFFMGQKARQYTDGLPQVALAARDGHVDQLFRSI